MVEVDFSLLLVVRSPSPGRIARSRTAIARVVTSRDRRDRVSPNLVLDDVLPSSMSEKTEIRDGREEC